MKTTALAIAIAMVLAAPAAAQQTKAKKKKVAKPAAETVQQVDQNEASWRLMKGALPLALPSWAMPLYGGMYGNQAYEEEQKWQQQQMKKQRAAQPPRHRTSQ